MQLERAQHQDKEAILELLAVESLPTAGIADHLHTTLVARNGGKEILGCAALEVYEDAALLRSVVVAKPQRGQGLGRKLIDASLEMARELEVPTLYLLTETAESFFARNYQFLPLPRRDAPPSLQASAEFNGACPDNAVMMARRL